MLLLQLMVSLSTRSVERIRTATASTRWSATTQGSTPGCTSPACRVAARSVQCVPAQFELANFKIFQTSVFLMQKTPAQFEKVHNLKELAQKQIRAKRRSLWLHCAKLLCSRFCVSMRVVCSGLDETISDGPFQHTVKFIHNIISNDEL